MTVDHPDWGGTALVHGVNILDTNHTILIPANSTVTASTYTMSKPGYLIQVQPSYQATSGATPFLTVQMNWYDPTVGFHFGEEDWDVYVGSAGSGPFITGHGVVKGAVLQIKMTNHDTAQPMVCVLDVAETTAHIAREDWRERVAGTIPGFTMAPGEDLLHNEVAMIQLSLTASSTKYLLPIYAGQAWLSLLASPVSTGTGGLVIQPWDTGAQLYDTGTLPASTSTINSAVITLPRKPCILTLFSPAGGFNWNLGMVAQEYAS